MQLSVQMVSNRGNSSDRISIIKVVKRIRLSSIIAHKNIDVSACNATGSPKTTRNRNKPARTVQPRGRRIRSHHQMINIVRKIGGGYNRSCFNFNLITPLFKQVMDKDVIVYLFIFM